MSRMPRINHHGGTVVPDPSRVVEEQEGENSAHGCQMGKQQQTPNTGGMGDETTAPEIRQSQGASMRPRSVWVGARGRSHRGGGGSCAGLRHPSACCLIPLLAVGSSTTWPPIDACLRLRRSRAAARGAGASRPR